MVASIFRRKMLILGLFFDIVMIVAIVTLLMPCHHESRMMELVKNERADLVVSPDARDGGQVRGDVNETEVNSEIELLTGTDILFRVVRACCLYEQDRGVMYVAGEPQPEPIERAVRKLQRDLTITLVRTSDITQFSYSALRPDLAASVLKELSSAISTLT